jgi:hypothetical protein
MTSPEVPNANASQAFGVDQAQWVYKMAASIAKENPDPISYRARSAVAVAMDKFDMPDIDIDQATDALIAALAAESGFPTYSETGESQ